MWSVCLGGRSLLAMGCPLSLLIGMSGVGRDYGQVPGPSAQKVDVKYKQSFICATDSPSWTTVNYELLLKLCANISGRCMESVESNWYCIAFA